MIPQFRNGRGYALALADGEQQLAPTLYLYDVLGVDLFGGIAARQVVDDIQALGDVPELSVRVNSPGGDVFEGVAVYNALSRFAGKVTVHIDGLAASIASLIALAGDTTLIAENAMFMVHRPWTVAMGDAEEMRRQADTLEKAWAAMRVTYSRSTGRRAETIERLVAAAGGEWWMTAEEAVKQGFADGVERPGKQAAVFGLRHFRKVPERLAARAADDDAIAPPIHPEVAEIEPPRVTREPEPDGTDVDDETTPASEDDAPTEEEETEETADADVHPPEPPPPTPPEPPIADSAPAPTSPEIALSDAPSQPTPTAAAARHRRIVEVLRLRA